MPLLDRAQILAADDLKHEDVDVPEWGGSVRVLELTANQRDAIEASMTDISQGEKGLVATTSVDASMITTFRARLAAYSIVNEQNERLFTDEDMAALGRKSSSALQRVFNTAMKLSAITPKDVEELVGKSEAAQSGDSLSDSASPSA